MLVRWNTSQVDGAAARYRSGVFTGIVRELGEVEAVSTRGDGARLEVRAPETAAGTGVGDSVAVNGACLTAVAADDGVDRIRRRRRDAAPHLARPPHAGLHA